MFMKYRDYLFMLVQLQEAGGVNASPGKMGNSVPPVKRQDAHGSVARAYFPVVHNLKKV
jgi:hypothetical protein